jgi:hypothetical protein
MARTILPNLCTLLHLETSKNWVGCRIRVESARGQKEPICSPDICYRRFLALPNYRLIIFGRMALYCQSAFFAFGLTAKLSAEGLGINFRHPRTLLEWVTKWSPMTQLMTNE